MYLKSLELQGFKSFPEKIKLEFDKGITAIVGPNGSGKSNISDAVRWVLGEQSVKSLRGAKMEDVIFSGTANRRALSFAEVSMTIDNSDGRMNIAYSEITVTRRVYRSGESQFMINRQPCRLRDIHELFMDTGVGREGYSIIGQGRVDNILSAKSDERRQLFDEAAGIVKYKNRRNEAETRLERERQNLQRVEDIIAELEGQLEPLAAQAEKARVYLELGERRKLLRVNIFLQETAGTEGEIANMVRGIGGVEAEIAENTDKQRKANANITALQDEEGRIAADIENREARYAETNTTAERKRNAIQLIHRNIEHMNADISRLSSDIDAKREAIRRSAAERENFTAKLKAAQLSLAAKNENLARVQTEYELLDANVAHDRDLIDKYTAEHIEKLRLDSEVKSQVEKTELIYEQLEERQEQTNEDLGYRGSRLREVEIKLLSLEKDIKEKNEYIAIVQSDNERYLAERQRFDAVIATDEAKLYKTDRALKDAKARQKLLGELAASYEGYYKSVKTVLKMKKEQPQQFSGVRGAVAELLQVATEYEVAVETALGGALQNIITETEQDAKHAIEFLRRLKAGRATFLPMSAIKGRTLGNNAQLFAHTGILGNAKQFVTYAPEYENIFSNLLERVLVADNIDNAIAFAKATHHEYKIVTLEGDLLNPGGSMTGGFTQKQDAGLLGRSRELSVLKRDIERLAPEYEQLKKNLDEQRAKRDTVLQMIERNKMRVQEVELEKASLNTAYKQAQSDLEGNRRKLQALESEKNTLMEQLVATNRELRGLKEQRNALEQEISEILQTVDKRQDTLKEQNSFRDAKVKEMTALRVEISGLTENLNAIQDNITRLELDGVRYNEEIVFIEQEISDLKQSMEDSLLEIKVTENEIEDLIKQNEALRKDITEVCSKRSDAQRRLKEAEESRVSCIERAALLNNEKNRLEMRKEQIETDIRRLYDEMWDEYGITKRSAQEYQRLEATLRDLQREERETASKIRELGSVNTTAIEEYTNVKERHGFLAKQRDDIISAEEKLKGIIRELNTQMKQQFTEQFALISESFGAVFAEMFGGGRAHLRLNDEEDVLNSGIEIIAQPPGKSLQNMSLFSGGERALIATTLLFAILRLKPSPFCILDEIEAALDDANVVRYANFLKNFAIDTQFIIITHRKGTMEAADVMYGVTMQEQGVSTLVSVKFDEAS